MKAISLIIMLLFPLYISAQDINPDSAFVDTVQEWHLKDHEWYKERMKIASVKAIKDICDDYAQSTYNSLNKIKENLLCRVRCFFKRRSSITIPLRSVP